MEDSSAAAPREPMRRRFLGKCWVAEVDFRRRCSNLIVNLALCFGVCFRKRVEVIAVNAMKTSTAAAQDKFVTRSS